METSRWQESNRIRRLPPYVFARVNRIKMEARWAGRDVIDLGMGNPDQPTPGHIVAKLCESATDPKTHRYSLSRGIPHLRRAVSEWYDRRFGVSLDPETEICATLGSKEGLCHMMLAILDEGDTVVVPNPTYPSHLYSVVIAGGNLCSVPFLEGGDFVARLSRMVEGMYPKPKLLVVSYPHNPTTVVADLALFEEIADFARFHGMMVLHDLAYSEITFDGYKAPSFLQVKGAKDFAVEMYSMSKTYSMAGWRVGFCVGNPEIVGALMRLKSYYDYGIFAPVQIAAIVALRGPQDCVRQIADTYQIRRDILVEGLNRVGWPVEKPKGTMYVWAKIPQPYADMGSMDFSVMLLKHGDVAVSPGLGFGEHGEGYVRFALVENEHRIKQAVKGIKRAFEAGG